MSVRNKKIFILGGSGYIGSHMTKILIENDFTPIVFDRVLLKSQLKARVHFIKGDLRKYNNIRDALLLVRPDVVMHFAGLIIAPESNIKPIDYFDNNVLGAVNLLKAMKVANVKKIVFSSTAAVYGNASKMPITEKAPVLPINTYGLTKLMFEQMLGRMSKADNEFLHISLRYFNAAGAYHSGDLGECHQPETHLIPNVLRSIKHKKELIVYGSDYPTKDGTCIRDYIHVEDLVEAHLIAVRKLNKQHGNNVINLGSGRGYSIKEVIRMAERVTGEKVRTRIEGRRMGDPAILIAAIKKAKAVLGWHPKRNLFHIIESAWKWENR